MSRVFWTTVAASCALVGLMSHGAAAGTITVTGVQAAYGPNGGIVDVTVPGTLEQYPWTTPILLYRGKNGTGTPLVVFCDDIFHYIYVQTPTLDMFNTGQVKYDSNDSATPPNGNPLSPQQSVAMGEIAQIGINDYRGNDSDGAIAAQAAIWAVEYGKEYVSISAGNTGIENAFNFDYTTYYTDSSYKGSSYFWGGLIGQVGVQSQLTTSVPELSTWAMMLLGFAGLGFAGYRRATRDQPFVSTAA